MAKKINMMPNDGVLTQEDMADTKGILALWLKHYFFQAKVFGLNS